MAHLRLVHPPVAPRGRYAYAPCELCLRRPYEPHDTTSDPTHHWKVDTSQRAQMTPEDAEAFIGGWNQSSRAADVEDH